MICYNCSNPALYHVTDPAVNDVYYCTICLPEHLKVRADKGDFDIVVEAPAPVSSKKSASAAPTE